VARTSEIGEDPVRVELLGEPYVVYRAGAELSLPLNLRADGAHES
jgi:hypothetical protein